MNRFAAVSVLALVLAVACDDATAPDRDQRQVGGPLFEQSPPGPSDRECSATSPVPPGTYQNIIAVPPGMCTISNSEIYGNITALEGSRLLSTNNIVRGNIQAVKAIGVRIESNNVGGGISIVEGPGSPPVGFPFDYDIRLSTVARDIYLSKNRGFIFVSQAMVPTGNITAVDNVIDPLAQLNINGSRVGEGIHVAKNKGGSIHVEGNLPPDLPFPITGKGNVKIEDNSVDPTPPGPVPPGAVSPHRLRIQFNRTAQNVQVFKNTVAAGAFMNVTSNTVGENLQVFTNTGGGSKIVTTNTAGESIQCKENENPFVSTGNNAPNEEDQCPPVP